MSSLQRAPPALVRFPVNYSLLLTHSLNTQQTQKTKRTLSLRKRPLCFSWLKPCEAVLSPQQTLVPTAFPVAISIVATRATTTTWSTAAFFTGLGFVHTQRTTSHILAVQRLDSRVSVGVGHFNKTESTKPTGLPVIDQGDRDDFAIRFECFPNRVLSCRKRQVTYIDPFAQLEPSPDLEWAPTLRED